MMVEIEEPTRRCKLCKKALIYADDHKKKANSWWINCRICRDKRAHKERMRREAAYLLAAAINNDGHTHERDSKKAKTHGSHNFGTLLGLLSIECSVCGEPAVEDELVKLSACKHEPDICKECFLGWLDSQLESTTWEKVQCPSSGCGYMVTHDDVKKYASDDVFTRFDHLSTVAFLSAEPNFRYCLAEGRKSGQIHDSGAEGNIFRCIACSLGNCTVHDVPFHTGETCAEFDLRRREEEEQRRKEDEERQRQDEQSVAEIEESTTKCPGCEVPIHKFAACDHITCSRCRFEFCYLCRAPYSGQDGIRIAGNRAHAETCRYHFLNFPDYNHADEPDAFDRHILKADRPAVGRIGSDGTYISNRSNIVFEQNCGLTRCWNEQT